MFHSPRCNIPYRKMSKNSAKACSMVRLFLSTNSGLSTARTVASRAVVKISGLTGRKAPALLPAGKALAAGQFAESVDDSVASVQGYHRSCYFLLEFSNAQCQQKQGKNQQCGHLGYQIGKADAL